jgi:hypothetical protein
MNPSSIAMWIIIPAVIVAGLAGAAALLYAAAYVVGAGLKASGALG